MSEVKLLGGAFVATLVKGENGKSTWQYSPNLAQIRKNSQKKGSEKERPQFEVINEIEGAAISEYRGNLKQLTLDITKHLLTLIKK
jgi:hypothetical protein